MTKYINFLPECYVSGTSSHIKKLHVFIRVNFSDLRDHWFNHNFNCETPICFCGVEDESSVHYFLCCHRYDVQRKHLLSKISDILGSDVTILPHNHLNHLLMYGSNVFNAVSNRLIIEETIKYIKMTGRFVKLEAFS